MSLLTWVFVCLIAEVFGVRFVVRLCRSSGLFRGGFFWFVVSVLFVGFVLVCCGLLVMRGCDMCFVEFVVPFFCFWVAC